MNIIVVSTGRERHRIAEQVVMPELDTHGLTGELVDFPLDGPLLQPEDETYGRVMAARKIELENELNRRPSGLLLIDAGATDKDSPVEYLGHAGLLHMAAIVMAHEASVPALLYGGKVGMHGYLDKQCIPRDDPVRLAMLGHVDMLTAFGAIPLGQKLGSIPDRIARHSSN